jgi:DNA-directed RNA polymerase alpha subunit
VLQLISLRLPVRTTILRLKAQGPGTVRASDFEKDADIEILTPEVPLATF